ncbi:MAG TPA: response regulator [Steroidobacteraceae bacterium]|jgi:excisionase family DNA binding protein
MLTPTEVAERLLVAPVTVRLWASRGLLPSVTTPGGHRRFRAQDVDTFIAQRQHVTGPATRSAPARVLIIDDDAQYARYLSSLLSSRVPGISVDMAMNGFSAGIKCEAMRPDLVTLDLHMPDMDGFDVCRLLRSKFGARRPRIVALSGYMTPENSTRIREAGADACLSKTTTAEALLREFGFDPTLTAQRPRARRAT